MRTLTIFALALAGMILSASGQGASRPGSPAVSDEKKQLSEAAEKLRQAQASGDLDKAKVTAKGLMGNLPGNLTDAAKAALQSPEVKAQAAAAARSLLPEAQKMMDARRQAAEDALPAAAGGTATAGTGDQPPAPEGPKPQLLQPVADSPPEATAAPGAAPTPARKAMAVIEADNSVFDPNTNILIYTGSVRARHPQFYIECEELIVHLEDEAEKKKDKPDIARKDPLLAPPKKKGSKEEEDTPVKKAIASGPMVKIEKQDPQGKVQRAFCRNAVYDGATGLITMRDNPQVQTDNVMQTSISPDTVMTFDKDGKFNSNRPTRTVILSKEE
jgi:lipopolysaccharide export system protein LptA